MQRYCARILLVNVLWGDLHIMQGRLNIGMPHQLHKCRQADSGAYHVGGEGVSEAMRVGKLNAGALAMVAEQGS